MAEASGRLNEARLRLIGRLRLSRNDHSAIELPSRRARGLLAYLALAPERSATREKLCGLLWSDRGETQARASLRQCLLDLRGVLSAAKLDLLDVGRELISLRPGAMSVDAEDVESALAEGVGTTLELLATIGADRLLDDLQIGGLFDEWRDQVRERLDRAVRQRVLAQLSALEANADWPRVRDLAEAFLHRDRLDETIAL